MKSNSYRAAPADDTKELLVKVFAQKRRRWAKGEKESTRPKRLIQPINNTQRILLLYPVTGPLLILVKGEPGTSIN